MELTILGSGDAWSVRRPGRKGLPMPQDGAFCINGNVYLIGEYNVSPQKSHAIKLAKEVEGVKSVTDYFLQKKAGDRCGTTDNLELVAKVKAKLIKDTNIWSTNVKVKSVRCNIVL